MSVKGDVISFNSYRDPVFLKSRVCGNELCASGHGYVPGVADKKRGRGPKRCVCLLLQHLGVCVFITAVPITKLFAWGEGDSGGHVLRA